MDKIIMPSEAWPILRNVVHGLDLFWASLYDANWIVPSLKERCFLTLAEHNNWLYLTYSEYIARANELRYAPTSVIVRETDTSLDMHALSNVYHLCLIGVEQCDLSMLTRVKRLELVDIDWDIDYASLRHLDSLVVYNSIVMQPKNIQQILGPTVAFTYNEQLDEHNIYDAFALHRWFIDG